MYVGTKQAKLQQSHKPPQMASTCLIYTICRLMKQPHYTPSDQIYNCKGRVHNSFHLPIVSFLRLLSHEFIGSSYTSPFLHFLWKVTLFSYPFKLRFFKSPKARGKKIKKMRKDSPYSALRTEKRFRGLVL